MKGEIYMKIIIVLAITALLAITIIPLTSNQTEPVDATTATVKVDTSSEAEETEEVKGAISLIEDAVGKIKNDVLIFIEDFNEAGGKEAYEELEKEATAFINKTIEEFQDRIPKDLKFEVVDFDVSKLNDEQLQAVKTKCEETSKYNPDKIKIGFKVSGKVKLTANEKTSNIDGTATILKVKNEWKLYESDFNFPEGFGLEDILKTN